MALWRWISAAARRLFGSRSCLTWTCWGSGSPALPTPAPCSRIDRSHFGSRMNGLGSVPGRHRQVLSSLRQGGASAPRFGPKPGWWSPPWGAGEAWLARGSRLASAASSAAARRAMTRGRSSLVTSTLHGDAQAAGSTTIGGAGSNAVVGKRHRIALSLQHATAPPDWPVKPALELVDDQGRGLTWRQRGTRRRRLLDPRAAEQMGPANPSPGRTC